MEKQLVYFKIQNNPFRMIIRLALLTSIVISCILSSSCKRITGIANAAVRYGTIKAIFSCIPEGTQIDTPEGPRPIESLQAGEHVIGYDGKTVSVLQKHCYAENPIPERFRKITFENGAVVNLCDRHRIAGIKAMDIEAGNNLFGSRVTSVEKYGGVQRSYDLLTTDRGYRINGVPVNSMIEEMLDASRNP